ncbi:hypothetical protein H7U32_01110 [Bifidobacterium pullorum subsp. saeculare]|uniref:Replication-associated protein ORF2/G2P domain-containing protein n=1 Tax=Bifidobacterium pullorum subsp. saeculare TaxID=78257 RepID=A0A939B9K9_9BIFI|nr:hypothetical protein [Bifidobacterium pullorum]MBM6698946.1 hypothetical protein [Bifidobacterium pullorum subsp. saeculare]
MEKYIINARSFGMSAGRVPSPAEIGAAMKTNSHIGRQAGETCHGWTPAVARRNEQALQRIDFYGAMLKTQRWEIACELYGRDAAGPKPKEENLLDYRPFAVTLTIPADAMPEVSAATFHRWLRTWIKRAQRAGMVHYYWILEFTAAGTPHVHCTAWMRPEVEINGPLLPVAWVEILKGSGIAASLSAQDSEKLDMARGPESWLVYQAKHASRGVQHYQRQVESMPPDWQTTSGRMWGHDRGLPMREPTSWVMSAQSFWVMRRLVQKANTASVTSGRHRFKDEAAKRRAITVSRRMRRCGDLVVSPSRGVGAWLPLPTAVAIMDALPYGSWLDFRDEQLDGYASDPEQRVWGPGWWNNATASTWCQREVYATQRVPMTEDMLAAWLAVAPPEAHTAITRAARIVPSVADMPAESRPVNMLASQESESASDTKGHEDDSEKTA